MVPSESSPSPSSVEIALPSRRSLLAAEAFG
jgi:hypothetical protein